MVRHCDVRPTVDCSFGPRVLVCCLFLVFFLWSFMFNSRFSVTNLIDYCVVVVRVSDVWSKVVKVLHY